MLTQFLAATIGYLLGSIPSAFFLVRWKSNVDIRNAGSGNVGTLNSYEVTESKTVGALVLLADVVKGALAVLLPTQLLQDNFQTAAFSGVGAVVGHNFPAWLGFKGGRGLATGAGVMLVLGWKFVPIWCALWILAKQTTKDVNVGNAIASFVLLLFVWLASEEILSGMIPQSASLMEFRIFMTALMCMILVKLWNPVRAFFAKKNS